MSVSRQFLINELKRLEFRFHPEGLADEQALEYIRAAIRELTSRPVERQHQDGDGVPRPRVQRRAS